MGLGDLWNRTLVYFGIAEEYDDAWDDDGYLVEEELEQTYAERPSANVRRLTPRSRGNDYDDWTVSESHALPEPRREPVPRREPPPPPAPARVERASRREAARAARPRSIEAVPSPAAAQ